MLRYSRRRVEGLDLLSLIADDVPKHQDQHGRSIYAESPVNRIAVLASAALAVLTGVSLAANPAPEIKTGSDLLSAYRRLESYCDTGRKTTDNAAWNATFERCALRDGRFKHTYNGRIGLDTNFSVHWFDGKMLYRFTAFVDASGTYTNVHYEESDPKGDGFIASTDDVFLGFVLRDFLEGSRMKDFEAAAKPYVINSDISDSEFVVVERIQNHEEYAALRRLWIGRSDGLIRRFERSGKIDGRTVISLDAVEANGAVPENRLTYPVPLLTRYSLFNRPKHFTAAVLMLTLITGWICWLALAIVKGLSTVRRFRRLLWKICGIVVLIIVGIVTIITLLPIKDGGHPSGMSLLAIFVGIPVAIALATGACFALSGHLVEIPARLLGKIFRIEHRVNS